MKNKSFVIMLATLLLGLCLSAMPAAAADLAQSKAAGQVGEQMNGLLGLVDPNAPADVKALVDSINAQRLAEYQRIATKNGVPADEVARLTAQKVIDQAGPGHYVQTPSGWQRR
ncbi:YdbL family protein [Methylomonas sp. LL1]|uniref:YdbL family protein n=1 Tax=Methylomonas sp. LL1 TaxID=2785785 RepID=UPI0018C3A59C|nr:YdbL family protein [Methylomonas sp. LL1]QPK62824.1 YdbL family protein [Methylomonas sp. LL1]